MVCAAKRIELIVKNIDLPKNAQALGSDVLQKVATRELDLIRLKDSSPESKNAPALTRKEHKSHQHWVVHIARLCVNELGIIN